MSLTFSPLIPAALLVALGILAALTLALAAFRRAPVLYRAAAALLLLAWLAGPALLRETRRALPDIALLVLDRTPSMALGHRAALAETAAASLRAAAARLPNLQLRTAIVPAGGHGTRLWQAASQALAEIPTDQLAGVILVTDGQIHDAPPATLAARLGGAPVHALIPAAGEEWQRRLRLLDAPAWAIVGKPVTVRAVLDNDGPGAPSAPATVTVHVNAATTTRRVAPGQPFTIQIPMAHPGPTLLALETPALPGEPDPLSPHLATATIQAVRDRLRVLLVSGEPTQDERTWRRLLKSDPAVDLVHFTILRPPEKDDTTPLNELALIAFPTRELFAEKLSSFDLVILDRFADRGILPHLYLRNIAEYVRHGGALLLVAGPEFAGAASLDQTPLADVLPAHAPLSGEGVVIGAYRPALTATGRRHPITETLPGANQSAGETPGWGSWYRAIAAEDVHGDILMRAANDQPLLIASHEGQGRAALLLSDQGWLWSRGHQGGGPEAELLRRLAHWLMAEPELEEESLTATAEAGRVRIARRTLSPAPPPAVTLTAPSGARQQVPLTQEKPGMAGASVAAAAPGLWRITDGARTTLVAATPADPEEADPTRATAAALAPVVQASGGQVYWLASTGTPSLTRAPTPTGATLNLPPRRAHQTTGRETIPLVPPWAALPLLLGAVVLAWRRESR